MSDLTNLNPRTLGTGANVLTNAMSAGPDRFPADFGQRYLLIFKNTTGASYTVKLDDPQSVSPASATSFDPDVPLVVPITTGVRHVTVDSSRFRDSTGWINWTFSAGTGVGSNVEIYGPLI